MILARRNNVVDSYSHEYLEAETCRFPSAHSSLPLALNRQFVDCGYARMRQTSKHVERPTRLSKSDKQTTAKGTVGGVQ